MHQHRLQAEAFVNRVDRSLRGFLDREDARGFSDYGFLVADPDSRQTYVQRSPLSTLPLENASLGLIGYFQVEPDGSLSTPLLPKNASRGSEYGLSNPEIDQRKSEQSRLTDLLRQNQLVNAGIDDAAPSSPAYPSAGASARQRETSNDVVPVEDISRNQARFDELSELLEETRSVSKKLEGLSSRRPIAEIRTESAAPTVQRAPRKERTASVRDREKAQTMASPMPADAGRSLQITTFESEVDPLDFALLDSGHIVMYRKVWRDQQRYIQGALFDTEVFIRHFIRSPFSETTLAQTSALRVQYGEKVLAKSNVNGDRRYLDSTSELKGQSLYRARLSDPFAQFALRFSVGHLPLGAGALVIGWSAVALAIVLITGIWLMYRLGCRQISLSQQQQDFVSAVSHELRTPLTSIRMYGEMLREGWTSDTRRKEYYNFIVDESERLSRLITNVLQLARLTRSEMSFQLKPVDIATAMDAVKSRVSTPTEAAGFELSMTIDSATDTHRVNIDLDHFLQVMINLVDNALKFSKDTDNKVIEIQATVNTRNQAEFSVRDYGPGVPKDQMRKIFRLFYRTENELSRETVGTGIGLALVTELVNSMDGTIDVENRERGASFKVRLPLL